MGQSFLAEELGTRAVLVSPMDGTEPRPHCSPMSKRLMGRLLFPRPALQANFTPVIKSPVDFARSSPRDKGAATTSSTLIIISPPDGSLQPEYNRECCYFVSSANRLVLLPNADERRLPRGKLAAPGYLARRKGIFENWTRGQVMIRRPRFAWEVTSWTQSLSQQVSAVSFSSEEGLRRCNHPSSNPIRVA